MSSTLKLKIGTIYKTRSGELGKVSVITNHPTHPVGVSEVKPPGTPCGLWFCKVDGTAAVMSETGCKILSEAEDDPNHPLTLIEEDI